VSDEQHMALPQLYGGPAYSRPHRPVQEIVRPFDPDELPLEAARADGEKPLATELTGTTWAPVSAPPVKRRGPRRSRAGKQAGGGKSAAERAATSPSEAAKSGLEGRPFSLRTLGRIFGSDRK
jgi:hypothetical protein